MSTLIGRRIFAQLSSGYVKKLSKHVRVVRFSSAANNQSYNLEETKNDIPASESGKVPAVVLKKFSESLILENVELPKMLQANEVLIDVHYCALNTSDALLSKNLYTFEPTLPMVLGYELVGKLTKVGEEAQKKGYKIGDKVIALNKDRHCGLAEQCIAEVSDIWKVPSGIKSVDAVGLLNDYITALVALERKVSIQEEDMILINVGASSIGLAAVDLATNVFKAEVISVCATEDGAALAREKGVLASFKYKDSKLLKEIQAIAADKNIEVVFNDADGEYFKKMLCRFTNIYKNDAKVKDVMRDDNFAVVVHHLSREGRVIIAGAASMADNDCDEPNDGFTISGFSLRKYRKEKPEEYRQAGDEVLEFMEEGLIKPTSILTVSLPNVNDALEFILNKKSPGKVIVDIKNTQAA